VRPATGSPPSSPGQISPCRAPSPSAPTPAAAGLADPPRLHGPYAEWTRKIAGKTITRRLPPTELGQYQPRFENAKKLRALIAELQDLTLEIIETDSPAAVTHSEPEPRPPENVG